MRIHTHTYTTSQREKKIARFNKKLQEDRLAEYGIRPQSAHTGELKKVPLYDLVFRMPNVSWKLARYVSNYVIWDGAL
jgi:hypothetical protein